MFAWRIGGAAPVRAAAVLSFGLLSLTLGACQAQRRGDSEYKRPEPRAYPTASLVLPSGLEIVVEHDDLVPVVGVVWLVRAGGADDPVGLDGLAHAVEHAVFRAADQKGASLMKRLLALGATGVNAGTSHDATTYHAFVHRELARDLIRATVLAAADPLANVDEATLGLEMGVVSEELSYHDLDGGHRLARETLFRAVYPANHPYARPVGGTASSLSRIKLAQARAFVAQHYQPQNMALLVAGDVGSLVPGDVAALMPAGLRGDPQRKVAPRVLPALGQGAAYDSPAPEVRTMTADVPMPEVWVGWSLPPTAGNQVAQHDLIRHLVRGEPGAGSAAIHAARLGSILWCHASVPPDEKPSEVADRIIDGVSQLWIDLNYHPNESWFTRMRAITLTEVALDLERLPDRSLTAAALLESQTSVRTSDLLGAITDVSLRDATQFARNYLVKPRARVVNVMPAPPRGTATAFRPVMNAHDGSRLLEAAVPPPAGARIDEVAHPIGVEDVRLRRLDNGLEVIVLARPRLPTATAILGFHAAPAPGENPAVRDRLLAAEDFYYKMRPSDQGMSFRRDVDAHALRDVLSVLSSRGDDVLAILGFLGRKTDAVTIEWSAQDFARAEPFLRARERLPETQARIAFWRALWGGHVYGGYGTVADNERLDEADIETWARRVRRPGNGALVVAGSVDVEAVLRQAGVELASWKGAGADPGPAGLSPSPPPLRAHGAVRRFVVHKPGVRAAALHFGCLLPPARDEGSLVTHDMLAEFVDTRLTEVLRTRAGASYAQWARAHAYRGGAAILEGWSDVDATELPRAVSAIESVLSEGGPPPFDAASLERLRWAEARRSNMRYGTSGDLADAVFVRWNLDWKLSTLDEHPARLAALSLQDLEQALAACRANAVLTIVGDTRLFKLPGRALDAELP